MQINCAMETNKQKIMTNSVYLAKIRGTWGKDRARGQKSGLIFYFEKFQICTPKLEFNQHTKVLEF